jgi:hypothetical protein
MCSDQQSSDQQILKYQGWWWFETTDPQVPEMVVVREREGPITDRSLSSDQKATTGLIVLCQKNNYSPSFLSDCTTDQTNDQRK